MFPLGKKEVGGRIGPERTKGCINDGKWTVFLIRANKYRRALTKDWRRGFEMKQEQELEKECHQRNDRKWGSNGTGFQSKWSI
ncbi:hypothetical protein X798_00232 [Onchocerca flexuosa]|uniref:Transposase n=2 Tax=Onchocerca flexuosa TaxID=387005 RepID=A0A183HJ47_9BILA|nr:hypothetical protein X798_00232 [Onchocerca flexuosa]VDO51316.1 unnamed protein product [Onchocerca flexuosa]